LVTTARPIAIRVRWTAYCANDALYLSSRAGSSNRSPRRVSNKAIAFSPNPSAERSAACHFASSCPVGIEGAIRSASSSGSVFRYRLSVSFSCASKVREAGYNRFGDLDHQTVATSPSGRRCRTASLHGRSPPRITKTSCVQRRTRADGDGAAPSRGRWGKFSRSRVIRPVQRRASSIHM
jgi:hypothetical protein